VKNGFGLVGRVWAFWGVVGVTITVTALLNNFNIPCPSARSAIMITKVQSESELSSKLPVL